MTKSLLNKIKSHPRFLSVFGLAKMVLLTGFSQVSVQLIGLLSGVLVIRNLQLEEYALYTIANTMLGAMNILSNGGILSGVMAEGGKVWQDKIKLGIVVNTGLRLRKIFSIASIIISGSVLIYLLRQNNASWLMSFIIFLSVLPSFYSGLTSSLLEVPPKLNQDILSLQKNQFGVALGRLLLLGSCILFLPSSFIALLSDGIPRILANLRLRKIAAKFIQFSNEIDYSVRNSILTVVKRVLPGDVYNIFSVQITIWILSFYGSTTVLAQVGALFRIAAVLTLFNVVFNTIFIPRYARLKLNRKKLISNMVLIQILLLLISIGIVGFVWIFSAQVIWVLGDNYKGLDKELVLVISVFCLNFISNVIYALCSSRAWVINPLILISVNLISIVIGAVTFNLDSLTGVLIYNIFVSCVMVLMHSIYSFFKVLTIKFEDPKWQD